MEGKSAVSLSEVEVLDEKVLNVRVFGDGTRPVYHITVPFFSQIIGVHVVEKPIVGIGVVMLVFGQDTDKAIFTTIWKPKPYSTKTDESVLVEDAPIVKVLFLTLVQVFHEDLLVHFSIVNGIIGIGFLNNFS